MQTEYTSRRLHSIRRCLCTYTADFEKFRFPESDGSAFVDKRVQITGSGKNSGIGRHSPWQRPRTAQPWSVCISTATSVTAST